MTVERVAQSLRLLKRHKRFSAMAVACLGLAVGLNTTMYSVLDAIISPRLDIRDPEQLYNLYYYGDYRGLIPLADLNTAIKDGLTIHQGVTGSSYLGGEAVAERGSNIREVVGATV